MILRRAGRVTLYINCRPGMRGRYLNLGEAELDRRVEAAWDLFNG